MPADHQVLVEAEAVCVQAVRQAGAVLLEYFRQPLTVEFKEKGQQSPVTEADRRSEELLLFPFHCPFLPSFSELVIARMSNFEFSAELRTT